MSLAQLLEEEQAHLHSLVALLRQEQDCLVQASVDGQRLSALADAKQQQLLTLENLELQRQKSLQNAGYENQPGAIEAAAREADCLPTWQEVKQSAAHASHLNQLNGSLIQQRLFLNQQALNSLQTLGDKSLYGADGQQRLSTPRLDSRA